MASAKITLFLRMAKAALLWLGAHALKMAASGAVIIILALNARFPEWMQIASRSLDAWVYAAAPSARAWLGVASPSSLALEAAFIVVVAFMWWARLGPGEKSLAEAARQSALGFREASGEWSVQAERSGLEEAAEAGKSASPPSRRLWSLAAVEWGKT